MDQINNNRQHVVQPLQIMIDIQLGPDGHPWVRLQFATPGMSTSIVFPHESAEDVISNITEGVRKQIRSLSKKAGETVVPDFTGIGVSNAGS